ncbi:MAG: two-component regulator propeller domain-containing protein [Bacteroidota bacterium]
MGTLNRNMRQAKRLFSFILLFFLPAILNSIFAQSNPTSFQHLSIENGLSDNGINCFVQDAEGFMWIGTEDGLNKYNGRSSKIYRHSTDSFSICSNAITCAFKDKRNRLWFGGNGLMLFNAANEKFISFRREKNNANGLSNNDITAITQDENGLMWIGTRQGLFQFDEATKKFTHFLHDTIGSVVEVYRRNRIIRMIPDGHGNIWMCTILGFYKFSVAGHIFTSYLYDGKDENTPYGNHITAIAFDKTGKLWLAVLDSTICTFDTSSKRFEPVHFPREDFNNGSRSVDNILCDSKGRIWIATSFNGIMEYNPSDNSWQNYTHDIFNSRSLCDNKTISLFEDQSGMVWIGTASRGVDRMSSRPDKFIAYTLQPGNPGSLCEDDITAVCEDGKGGLWLGSKNGLMYLNRKTNYFQCFRHDDKNKNSLSHNLIYALAMDTKQNLWIASDNGLNYYDPAKGKWKCYFHNEKNSRTLPGTNVYEVIVRSNGEVWAGTSSGFCRFNAADETFESEYNNLAIGKYTREYYNTMFEDSRHTVWLSTSRSGIFNADGNFNILHSYYHSDGFDANVVHQFAETAKGNILMATDAGLFLWNCKTFSVSKLKSEDANLDGDLKSVLVEDDKSIWVGTAHGLLHLAIENDSVLLSARNFNSVDGLQSDAFNFCSALKLSSGEFVFGGINGFNLFLPGNIIYNDRVPPVHISSFKVFDKNMIIYPPDSVAEVNLDYGQNYLSFEMAALNFDHPEKNRFAYQLEGFDKEIIFCGTNHAASYTNIPPGKYNLHILASNNDGIWNMEGARVNITIVPPFWKTGWFRMVAITFLCLLAYLFYYLRIRKIKREEKRRSEINRQIAEARLTALSAQMNPHFIFNSLNSIQHFISESEKENALKYLSKFSKLIRLVLQNAGKNSNSIANEISMLEFYLELEALRFSNKFSYHFVIDPGIDKEAFEIPSMLLQPYVENAIIHGLLNKSEPGQINIKFSKMNDKLLCIIEDNGIGRLAAATIKNKKLLKNESLGMKMTEERMQMLERITNKKVKIVVVDLKSERGEATGTRVEIEIALEE